MPARHRLICQSILLIDQRLIVIGLLVSVAAYGNGGAAPGNEAGKCGGLSMEIRGEDEEEGNANQLKVFRH